MVFVRKMGGCLVARHGNYVVFERAEGLVEAPDQTVVDAEQRRGQGYPEKLVAVEEGHAKELRRGSRVEAGEA